jgi:hypothetical protein
MDFGLKQPSALLSNEQSVAVWELTKISGTVENSRPRLTV